MRRDFTFIDDVVNVFTELINRSKADDEPMYNIPNAGDQRAVTMGVFASIIERLNDNNTIRNFSPTELVDVFTAFSYTKRLKSYAGFTPDTELENGLQKTIERYWSRIGPNGNDMFILNVN